MTGVASQHAIVTSAAPDNDTIVEGDSAVLRCRVKALKQPHIKWLKKLDPNEFNKEMNVVSIHTLNENERYLVLDSGPDVMIGEGEYMNKFIINHAKVEDTGMYICFVTNSGYGALTYKSTYLRVMPSLTPPFDIKGNEIASVVTPAGSKDSYLLYLVISVIVVTFILALTVVICIIRRSQSAKRTTDASMKRPDEDDCIQQRPFLMAGDLKYDGMPTTLPPPPPPSSLFPSSNTGPWSRTVYPLTFNHHSQRNLNSSHYENPFGSKYNLRRESPVVNQYEVPYSHLFSGANKSTNSTAASSHSLNPLMSKQQQQQHSQPQTHFKSTQLIRYSPQGVYQQPTHPEQQPTNVYPFSSFQYFGGYEA